MTLEETCQHYKAIAENFEKERKKAIADGERSKVVYFERNAEYFNQIAEWLARLKAYEEDFKCSNCKFEGKYMMCEVCRRFYTDMFVSKEANADGDSD